MLVLSRRPGTSIVINNEIVVTIIEVKGDKVRVGITADPSIPIVRSELIERVEENDRRRC